ncbi:MAG: hypothetical protein L0220_19575 [Acidobacteria bacterium]|nr:hypothetical protein [Acidobacteriota bacterium]
MGEQHIIELLDTRPLSDLRDAELSAINEHTASCLSCRQAFQAAQLSNLLLRSRAELKTEPSAFFKTNLIAAIKDEQVQLGPFSVFRIWREAYSLIYSMAALAVIIGGLTLSQLGSNTQNMRLSTTDPLEMLVYGTDSASVELSYGEVLMDLYGPPTEKTERNRQEK